MAEQTFRSPGFFDREIDLSEREAEALGTPAGIIGTALRGPAFVPVTIGSFADFEARFGTLDPDHYGPYAVSAYLENRDAVTYMRVLGAGSNNTSTKIDNTKNLGYVDKAGFKIASVALSNANSAGLGGYMGAVQLLVAKHYISSSESDVGFPEFIDNDSFPNLSTGGTVNLVRGMIFTTSGSRAMITSWNTAACNATTIEANTNLASIGTAKNNIQYNTFKLYISSSTAAFSKDDNTAGVKSFHRLP